MSPRSRSHQCGLGRIHKSRPKGLNQVNTKSKDDPKIQNPTQLEEQCGPYEQRARAMEA